jgi:DnaJ-class molecular chaperone
VSDDPYADLGVARTATQNEIKRSYRRIAKESHPDLNPGDAKAAERFRAAASAYDLLKDAETRARFDRGEIDARGQERPERRFYRDYAEGPEATYHTSRGFEDFGDYSDIFNDLFGRRGQRFRAGGAETQGGAGARFEMRGADQRYALEVSFLEAAKGAVRRITLPGGDVLDVKIPEGVADGQTIRLRGKGAPGIGGGEPGDALVTVSVTPHPEFRREGNDIWLTLPVSLDEAVLGGKIETPTIDGPVSLTVPRGASSGQVLRLRGRGIRKGEARGDQHVEIRIVTPPEIDAELEEFFRKWRETHGYDPRKGGLS